MPDLTRILGARTPLVLASAPRGFVPSLLADLARARAATGSGGRVVFIAPGDHEMQAIADTAGWFAPELEIVQFPAWDCLPYDRSAPAPRIVAQRISALHRLQQSRNGPLLVLTTVNAVLQRTLTPFRVRQTAMTLQSGARINHERLIAILGGNGYVRTDTVHEAGEYAVRGGIIDLFPPGETTALRIDFFGDEIESIRLFDPADQRSVGSMDGFTLLPGSEVLLDADSISRFRSAYRERFGATATGDPLYQAVSEGRRHAGMEHWQPLFEERMDPFVAHLDPADLILRADGSDTAAAQRLTEIADYFTNREDARKRDPGSYRPLPPQMLYLDAGEWDAVQSGHPIHLVTGFAEPESATVIDFDVGSARDFAPERKTGGNVYSAVADHLAARQTVKTGVIIASYSVGSRSRLKTLLAEHGAKTLAEAEDWNHAQGLAATAKTALVVLPLDHGFRAPALELLTEQDILGDRLVRRRKVRKNIDAFLAEIQALSEGDLMVHAEHGIGRYEGLTSIPVGKSPHDCVTLSYAGGDRLYVPVENIDILSRYGSDTDGAMLDKLGGEAWQRRKAQMKDRVREIAHELMRTAAARALRPGEIAVPEASAYDSFVDRFPYEETEDQDRVIAEVMDDLASGTPMDRLVCGDVGFGKTEVALRAAFAVAMSGMQVAIIAPTTLLARQHFTNFTERFKGLPVNIGRLSRLVGASEARATREGLTNGRVDIVIGTHALLAKSVAFKRLAMVVIDEEQRFGVTHKERLKAMKADVHVLTLTATPIPRTLQMAMGGLRALSVIQTPPVDRLAIRTYVMPWDPVVMREALLREHYRGGQSFIVVPRIADLPELETFLARDLPEIKAITAHGQLSPTQVEERMSAFYDGRYDVLLSTTIVESGLDIPAANTLIIHRADRFGLSQLYQLRGRVGRSKQRAYAYLTTPADRVLSVNAEKRLKVLGDLDSLGAGFQLAAHDLDMRGAGNMVGDEQSGHIREVGFELYQAMLEDAILAARAGFSGDAPPREAFSPQISIDAPILIGEDYVPDLGMRMGLYRRINEIEDVDAIEGYAAELIDRFGPLPGPTANLLKLMEIKLLAIGACVARLEVGPKATLVTFQENSFPNVPALLDYVSRLGETARLRPDHRLVINRVWNDADARLNGARQLMRGLAKAASRGNERQEPPVAAASA